MAFVEECHDFAQAVWKAYENHPFIEGLVNGQLTPQQFIQFQLDDGAHVVDYNRALALGIAKAPAGHPWAEAAARILSGQSTPAELAEKQAWIDELGFQGQVRSDRWTCSPAREGYVNHVMRTAYEGTFAHIATCLYPCSLFTQVIGKRFQAVHLTGPHAFRRWADVYVRPARTEMCTQHAAVMEEAARDADERERAHLHWIYRRSLEHQVRVFDAAWELAGHWPGQRSRG